MLPEPPGSEPALLPDPIGLEVVVCWAAKCMLDVLNNSVSGEISEQNVLSLLNCILNLYLCVQQT